MLGEWGCGNGGALGGHFGATPNVPVPYYILEFRNRDNDTGNIPLVMRPWPVTLGAVGGRYSLPLQPRLAFVQSESLNALKRVPIECLL